MSVSIGKTGSCLALVQWRGLYLVFINTRGDGATAWRLGGRACACPLKTLRIMASEKPGGVCLDASLNLRGAARSMQPAFLRLLVPYAHLRASYLSGDNDIRQTRSGDSLSAVWTWVGTDVAKRASLWKTLRAWVNCERNAATCGEKPARVVKERTIVNPLARRPSVTLTRG